MTDSWVISIFRIWMDNRCDRYEIGSQISLDIGTNYIDSLVTIYFVV